MNLKKLQPRVARALVAILAAGFIQVGVSAPAANAAPPIKPTITSVTSDAGTITVNMATTGIDATQWRWSLTRRQTFGCDNSYTDGFVQSTGSLTSSIQILGTTEGCRYLIKVAGFNGVIGEYAEYDEVAGGATNGLNIFIKTESGVSANMTRTPLNKNSPGICNLLLGRVNNIDVDYGTASPSPGYCPVDGFTSYYIGYIKAPFTGAVNFRSSTDDGFVLNIQGQSVISNPNDGAATIYNLSGTINMVANEIYRFEAWHHDNSSGSSAKLYWDWSGSGAAAIVPQSSLGTDPTVFFGTCPLGMTAQCAAGSAMEIKRATNTNMDGNYWIMVNGVPTLTYCIMNSVMSGGGWMLALKGAETGSVLSYSAETWTNTSLMNESYPARWSRTDTTKNTDAKYGVFTSNKTNQIMALYPRQSNYAGGAIPSGTTGNTSNPYGFSWIETTTAGRLWGQSDGDSYNVNSGTGKPNGSFCINVATTLTNLFTNSSRCAFRTVNYLYSSGETPYSAIGQNLFYSQINIRFFGINYANSSGVALARFGFGWNENGATNESSNDGSGGIGLNYSGAYTVYAGSINNCCADANASPARGQYGISGSANGSSTPMPYEMYIRNSTTGTINGSNLRVNSKRINSLTAGNGYSVSGSNGTNTFRLSPAREGFYIEPSTGKITVSEQIAVGDYSMSVTSTDTDGVVGVRATTVQVLSDSRETDTALSFSGTATLSTSGTLALTGDQTWEAWVRPTSDCSSTQKTIIGNEGFVILCISGYWWAGFRNSAGTWTSYQSSQRIAYDDWAHIAVVRSGTTASMYVNNARVTMFVSSAWSDSWSVPSVWATASSLYFGGFASGQYYSGLIDEVKIWDEARTLNQIVIDMHASPDLGSPKLLGYWDFNDGAGSAAVSRAQRSDSLFNISPTSGQYVFVATTTTSGPYTVVTVPRTLISTNPGWRAPDSITALFAMIVAGGGGGGGGTQGGGGGGGGVLHSKVNVEAKQVYPIRIGMGGRGAYNPTAPMSGDTSTAFGVSATGGGAGASEFAAPGNQQYPGRSGGSGGGSTWGSFMTGASGISGQGFNGGNTSNLESPACSPGQYAGAGGGGGSSNGGAPSCSQGGNGGAGKQSLLNSNIYGGGGGGSLRSSTTSAGRGSGGTGGGGGSAYVNAAMPGAVDGAQSGSPGTGGGGGAGISTNGATGFGGDGGSGTVIFRYITSLKPTFTQPSNTTLNVGMTETFTLNVAQDSATAELTRSFRWESSTTGASGTFSLIKQGTGAANASFSWVPPDTSTTGSNFRYRVIVTDSDTAGLFIQETSTAVFATINGALRLASKSILSKTVNISKTETFTVLSGTPGYRYSLLPDGPNFWLDTSTVGSPRIRFLDTATVGTYYETFTVTDSVSASIVVPLTIVVSPPPSFSANAEQVDTGTVLYLDSGNTSSYPGSGTTWSDLSGLARHANTNGALGARFVSAETACVTPSYSTDNLGTFNFSKAAKTCVVTPELGILNTYTVQTWFKTSGPQVTYTALLTSPYSGPNRQLNIMIFWRNGNLTAGIFDGYNFFESTGFSTSVVPNDTWVFATLTFDGNSVKFYLDRVGASQSSTTTTASSRIAFTAANGDSGLVIGRRWDGNDDYFNGSIATVRIYNRVLTTNEIAQNFNATKGRFYNTQNKQNQSGKYGTGYSDTFTVTAGSETITAAWSNSSLTRIRWDTSTVRSLVLSSQESLTPGTYYDTITVTDVYGSLTRLPLTYTIAKADTITVLIETPTALNYTGTNAVFPTALRVTGLVSSDTGTAIASVRYRPGGTSCATGGICNVGDIGPGGGVVFITPTTAGGNGRYFEAAPATWAGADETGSNATYCSNSNLNLGATNVGIGWGDTNTSLARTQCLGGAVARVNSFNSSNNTGFSDWFIPSTNELIELAKVRAAAGLIQLGSNWTVGRYGYWSSTEVSASVQASLVTSSWAIGGTAKSDGVNNFVRPVRSFTPCWSVNACSAFASTNKPTDAGIYAINGETLTLTSGSLSNYLSVKYETTTVTINKINQVAQYSTIFSSTFPETMTLFVTGGSGNGAIAYNLTAGGTATGCTVDFKKVAATSVGTCNVQVVRLGDRNFNTDTATAYASFVLYLLNQVTSVVGGGPTIALTGETSIIRDANVAPTISGLSATSGAVGTTITITGAGFYFANPSQLSIKFWRNIGAITYTINSDTSVTVTIPTGATNGRIILTTPNGQAASSTFTVTP